VSGNAPSSDRADSISAVPIHTRIASSKASIRARFRTKIFNASILSRPSNNFSDLVSRNFTFLVHNTGNFP
jgi:hypothetical protein